jgi:hypothetical protein
MTDTTDTTPTPEAGSVDSRDISNIANVSEPTTDAPKADEAGPNAEAARYRTRLREAETERDTIAGRLTGYQRAEAERLAAAGLSRASDLWLDGLDVAELLDEAGQVDADKVATAVAAVLDGRPQLAAVVKRPRPDMSQGVHAPAADSGWQGVLRGGRR